MANEQNFCMYCGQPLAADYMFCTSCGRPVAPATPVGGEIAANVQGEILAGERQPIYEAPFAPIEQTDDKVALAVADECGDIGATDERELIFASGLPEWSLEPPQVVVRRAARR